MPKPKEEREQLVKDYYQELKDVGIEISDEELQQALDTSEQREKIYESAQAFLQNMEAHDQIQSRVIEENSDLKPVISVSRMFGHLTYEGDSEEIKAKNRELYSNFCDKDKFKKFVTDIVKEVSEYDLNKVDGLNAENISERMKDPEEFKKLRNVFVVQDYLDAANKANIDIDPKTVEKCHFNVDALTTPYNAALTALKMLYTNPRAAYLNPEGPGVKNLLENYADNEDLSNDLSSYVFAYNSQGTEIAKKGAQIPIKGVKLLEEKGIEKTRDNLANLVAGKALSFMDGNQAKRVVMGKDGNNTVWDEIRSQKKHDQNTREKDFISEITEIGEMLKPGEGQTLGKDENNLIKAVNTFLDERKKYDNKTPIDIERGMIFPANSLGKAADNYIKNIITTGTFPEDHAGKKVFEIASDIAGIKELYQDTITKESGQFLNEKIKPLKTDMVIQQMGKKGMLYRDGKIFGDTGLSPKLIISDIVSGANNGKPTLFLEDGIDTRAARSINIKNDGSLEFSLNTVPIQSMRNKSIETQLQDMYQQLEATGSRIGDSKEFKEMKKACKTALDTVKNNPDRTQLKKVMKNLGEKSDDYFNAKLEQSKNERRAKRFEISQNLRNISEAALTDNPEVNVSSNKNYEEMIAAKSVRAAANKLLKSKDNDLKELGKTLLTDKEAFKNQVKITSSLEDFKKLVSPQSGINFNSPEHKKYIKELSELSGDKICSKMSSFAKERQLQMKSSLNDGISI